MPKTQPPRHGKHTGPGSAGRRRWRLTFLVAGALAVAAIPTAWVMTRSPAPATHHEALNTGLRPTAQTEEVSLWTPEVKIKPRSFTEDTPVELGTRFTADHDGWVSGIRFFKASGEKGGHSGSLWDADGHRLAKVTFTDETASGWQEARFAEPARISQGIVYTVSFHSQGRYVGQVGTEGARKGPLSTVRRTGVYAYGKSGFPRNWNPKNYN